MSEPLQQFEGKYEIITKLAEGGMGAVYKVRHRLLDEIRVVKVMRPQLEDQAQSKSRFLREARIAVKVKHDNIAQMYDFSIDDQGTAFIVMEFIDGVTLQGVLKKAGPPTVALALEIAVQSLQALGYLHRKGIVHRDISPDNLMLAKDDHDEPMVKLIDLGIAKLTGGESNLTGTGVFLGKVRYASPEHFKSQEGVEVNPVSDIYSFGLVLYELLTGSHPIKGSGWSEMIAGHLFQPPMDFSESDPDNRIPEQLRQIVLRSIAKDPGDRFADAKSFRSAIREIQSDFTRFPDDLHYVLSLCDIGAKKEPAKPGSTQNRLDEHFQAGLTAEATRVETDAPGTAEEERVTALISAAEKLVDLRMHSEARLQIKAALQMDPANQRAKSLQARVEEAERWAEALSQTVGKAESLLDAGELGEASAVIESGVRRLGEADQLLALRARLGELRAMEKQEAVATAVAEAQRQLESGQPALAAEAFERALQLDPDRSDISAKLDEVRAIVKQQEEAAELQRAVVAAAAEVEKLIAADQLDEAQAKLDEATARLGDFEDLKALHERLQTLRQQRLAEQVAALDEEGQALLAKGEHEQALARFDQALALDPPNPVLQTHRADAKQALDKARQQELRRGKIDEVVSEVETHLKRDRIEEAEVRLKEAMDLLGSADEFGVLDTKIRKARDQQRAAAAEAALTRAQALSAAGKHDEAVAKLEELLVTDPDNATVERRLAEARQAARAQQAEVPTTRMEVAEEEPTAPPPDRTVADQLGPPPDVAATESVVEEPTTHDTLPLGYRAPAAETPTTKMEADATISEAAIPELPPQPPPTPAAPQPPPTPAPSPRPQVKPEPRPARPQPVAKKPSGTWKIWAGVAAAVVVAAVAVVLVLRPGGGGDTDDGPGPIEPGPPGTLVVNALPWGELVRIEDARGVEHELPEDRYTPLWLELPEGSYRLSLRSPSGDEPVVIEADIAAGQTSRAEERFNPPEVEQFLSKYGL